MNNQPRYIKLIEIKTKRFTFRFSIGNPMWFIQEIKLIKGGNKNA